MGFAVAAAAADRGARVTLVTTATHPAHPGIDVRPVETADEMLEELKREIAGADVLVMAAAVADFRPARVADNKIRREETSRLSLDLEQIPDLVAALGARGVAREPDIVVAGFRAEVAHYTQHSGEGSDEEGLARLQQECARVFLDAVKSRTLMEGAWFKARWGHLFTMLGDTNMKSRFDRWTGASTNGRSVGTCSAPSTDRRK